MKIYQQFLTDNECYQRGTPMTPRGIMVHSTGANNPNLSRYVPGNEEIGINTSGTHWNVYRPGGRQVCVHAFVGKMADGSVGIVQTLPWTMQGWHAGKRQGNANYIGFEICEDDLTDPEYFNAVYNAALSLCVDLCQQFDLSSEDILCHSEGYRLGIASNHADVMHWFPRHGKNMDIFCNDVAERLRKDDETMTQEQFDTMMADWLRRQNEKTPTEPWMLDGVARAVAAGVSDGSRPMGIPTRAEVMMMAAAQQRTF